jgi:hypothetical protein
MMGFADLAAIHLGDLARLINDGDCETPVEDLVSRCPQQPELHEALALLRLLSQEVLAQRAVRVTELEPVDGLLVVDTPALQVIERIGALLQGLVVEGDDLQEERLVSRSQGCAGWSFSWLRRHRRR